MPYLSVRLIVVPWLIPQWARAQVWWNVILLRRGVEASERLLAHELAHVRQWQTMGFISFLFSYLKDLSRYGYHEHPLERAARAAEQHDYYRAWARQIIKTGEESSRRVNGYYPRKPPHSPTHTPITLNPDH